MLVPVVEDDPIVAFIYGMTSEKFGHFKNTANNIETALFELKTAKLMTY